MNKALKKKFIETEIYILAWNGAVQRNNVYDSSCSVLDRTNFKKNMITYLNNFIMPKYNKIISEDDHCENISNLKKYAEKIGKDILFNQCYKIGTAQKLLNLSLKYFWCIDLVVEPPHCPIDRIILSKVGINNVAWTQISTIMEYINIISDIRNRTNRKDLAQWELEVFNRR